MPISPSDPSPFVAAPGGLRVRLLAREWRLARAALAVAAGAAGRRKTLAIAGDPSALLARCGARQSARRGGRR